MMDWSPVLISMKTASISIFITFFLGLIVAWGIIKIKNDTIKVYESGDKLKIKVNNTTKTLISDFDKDEFNYNVKLYDFNKNDPAWMVEKRRGIGWTVNLANPKSWIFIMGIIAVVIIGVIFSK